MPKILVDERGQYEIIPNGHSRFMTKATQRKMLEGAVQDMDRATIEALSQESLLRAQKAFANRVPELVSDYGSGKNIVTLRLRALPGRSIPDLSEGDFISGTSASHSHEKRRKGYREFRVLDIFWGTKTLVNLLVDGSAARKSGRSTSDTNAYVICETVI